MLIGTICLFPIVVAYQLVVLTDGGYVRHCLVDAAHQLLTPTGVNDYNTSPISKPNTSLVSVHCFTLPDITV